MLTLKSNEELKAKANHIKKITKRWLIFSAKRSHWLRAVNKLRSKRTGKVHGSAIMVGGGGVRVCTIWYGCTRTKPSKLHALRNVPTFVVWQRQRGWGWRWGRERNGRGEKNHALSAKEIKEFAAAKSSVVPEWFYDYYYDDDDVLAEKSTRSCQRHYARG